MIKFKYLILLLVLSGLTDMSTPTKPTYPFYENVSVKEKYTVYKKFDSEVYLVKDSVNNLLFYFSDIKSPVCEDKQCMLLQIKVFWDLAGNFLGLEVGNHPLTKTGHKKFSPQDYYKLYRILNNPSAEIRKYDKSELVDYHEISTDAISSATIDAASDITVEGAAFTTWFLWHYIYDTSEEALNCYINSETENKDNLREQLQEIENLNTFELNKLLYKLEQNHLLRKRAFQEMLISKFDRLSDLNILLIYNYLYRHNRINAEIQQKLNSNKKINQVLNKMISQDL